MSILPHGQQLSRLASQPGGNFNQLAQQNALYGGPVGGYTSSVALSAPEVEAIDLLSEDEKTARRVTCSIVDHAWTVIAVINSTVHEMRHGVKFQVSYELNSAYCWKCGEGRVLRKELHAVDLEAFYRQQEEMRRQEVEMRRYQQTQMQQQYATMQAQMQSMRASKYTTLQELAKNRMLMRKLSIPDHDDAPEKPKIADWFTKWLRG